MSERERRWSHDLVDCTVVLGTIGLVLTLLDESFWSRSYLVAGMVPVAFLLALAWAARRAREGVWIYSLVAVVAYAPLGALAALHRPGPWIVPGLETMNRVLGETVIAPGLFVTTLPPVEASGTLMLLPYAIGYVAAVPAAWLALATQRPIAPAVPVVACLGVTIPVAVLVPDYYVLRGVVLTVVLVTWAVARARRTEFLVADRRNGVLATVAAVTVVSVVAGLVGLLVPDNDQTDRVRLDPAGADRVASAAADTLVPPGAGRDELFRVTGAPSGVRVRFGALDHYDGEAWVPADESPGAGPEGTFRRLGREIEPLNEGFEVKVRVRIRPAYASDWLPTLGELTSLELDYTDGRTQLDDVRYNQATASALVVGGVDPRDDYRFTAVVTDDGITAADAAAEATADQRQPEGAFLDPFLAPFDRAELAPVQRVLLLARYLRLNGATRLAGSSSQAPVDLGLRLLGAEQMAATPFQYAAVTALGASRLGVPARVVVGAEPGRRGIVTRNDVEAWVELQVADGTWHTLEPERFTGVHAYAEDAERGEVEVGGWVGDELDLDEDQIKIPKGADIELSPDAVIEEESSPWGAVVPVLSVLVALGVLGWLLVPVAKLARRRRRRGAGGWSGAWVNGWQEILDAARDRGTPVPDGWSRVAQAGHLGVDLDLARRADAAVFAPEPVPADVGRNFWDACQAERRALVHGDGARRRAWTLFNPASLLAGWARRRDASPVRHVRDEDRGPRRQHAASA